MELKPRRKAPPVSHSTAAHDANDAKDSKDYKDAYAASGVDRAGADRFVERIALLTRSTLNRRVKASVGGYASLYALDARRWIAASTDGVGTKLKLAFELGIHDTVGIDLVAMSVNDLLCVGAEPLFFLDYFATGKLDSSIGESVLRGIVAGCKEARCALVGGETAEMPSFYSPGEYDLAGFAVGSVDAKDVLPSRKIKPGDVLIGLASSGFHSNGFSLIRRLLTEADASTAFKTECLTPTRIYAGVLAPLISKRLVKGSAHITGSGFLNVPRMSTGVDYEIELPSSGALPEKSARLWKWLDETSRLSFAEQVETFNCGIGMVLVVEARRASAVLAHFRRVKQPAWVIGKARRKAPRSSRQKSQVFISRAGGGKGSGASDFERAVLDY